jgi:hypothetical protein
MGGLRSIFREVGAESECLRSCYHNYKMATHLFDIPNTYQDAVHIFKFGVIARILPYLKGSQTC